MNRYLLDTNVVSELRKPKPHGAVLEWLAKLREDQLYVSAVTVGELQAGAERVREQDLTTALEIEAWLDRLAASSQVLPMDTACFREWARLMHRTPQELLEDAMIAATARIHDLTVATRNERDFAGLGVRVLNPFKSGS